MDRHFEEIGHTADVALRVWGRDRARLFANAARGLAYLLGDAGPRGDVVERQISVEAIDAEALLVSWLEELLFLSERESRLFEECEIQDLSSSRLRATVRGRPVQEWRYAIKAVTFSDLEIVEADGQLETTIVFDV